LGSTALKEAVELALKGAIYSNLDVDARLPEQQPFDLSLAQFDCDIENTTLEENRR